MKASVSPGANNAVPRRDARSAASASAVSGSSSGRATQGTDSAADAGRLSVSGSRTTPPSGAEAEGAANDSTRPTDARRLSWARSPPRSAAVTVTVASPGDRPPTRSTALPSTRAEATSGADDSAQCDSGPSSANTPPSRSDADSPTSRSRSGSEPTTRGGRLAGGGGAGGGSAGGASSSDTRTGRAAETPP